MNKKIVFADFTEYNDQTSRLGNYHYCNCFCEDGYEALWFSNSYNPLIYWKDKGDYRFKKSISSPQRHELAPRVYGFAPFSLRLYGNYFGSRNPDIVLNHERYIFPNIRHTLRQIQFDEVDLLWISNPKHYWLTNVVRYNTLIYRIADDYTQYKEFPNVGKIEERLIQKADHVFVTASNLREKAERVGKEAHLLSNGVQYEHFAQSMDEPDEFKQHAGKKIIYVGAIKYWLDVQLIRRLALETDADLFLIGKAQIDLSELDLPNVHILGSRPYERIPAYLQHSDAAIIPFKKSQATDAVSPIKLYEYCSAGIAVVCSDMEEVKKLSAPIHIAENDDRFVQAVRQVLQEGYDREPLIRFGKSNTWRKRYEQVMRQIADERGGGEGARDRLVSGGSGRAE